MIDEENIIFKTSENTFINTKLGNIPERKLKVFFSGTFGEGTFGFNWDNEDEVIKALKKDYRISILGDEYKLFQKEKEMIINHGLDIIYTGPFWKEHDANGNHTTTDCMSIMRNEIEEINDSDLIVCVLSNIPSTGSCGEIMHTINSKKPCCIFYQYDENIDNLTIKARHWWIICYALNKIEEGYPIEIYQYRDINNVKKLLNNTNFYNSWRELTNVR